VALTYRLVNDFLGRGLNDFLLGLEKICEILFPIPEVKFARLFSITYYERIQALESNYTVKLQ
jgi:hypothetical protein